MLRPAGWFECVRSRRFADQQHVQGKVRPVASCRSFSCAKSDLECSNAHRPVSISNGGQVFAPLYRTRAGRRVDLNKRLRESLDRAIDQAGESRAGGGRPGGQADVLGNPVTDRCKASPARFGCSALNPVACQDPAQSFISWSWLSLNWS